MACCTDTGKHFLTILNGIGSLVLAHLKVQCSIILADPTQRWVEHSIISLQFVLNQPISLRRGQLAGSWHSTVDWSCHSFLDINHTPSSSQEKMPINFLNSVCNYEIVASM